MHFNLTAVLHLFHGVDLGDVSVFFVQLEDQVLHQHEFLDSDCLELLGGEEFLEEQLELLQLVVLSNALLTTNQLIYPFVVLSSLGLVLLQLVPNALECRDVDLDLITKFVNESE